MMHLTKENFDSEVLKSDLPVVIDCWAPWCGPCQMMGPVFEELSNDYKESLKFTKLNTDEEGELANQYSIQGIPCLIVTNKGKEIDRIVGFAPKEQMKEKIDSIINNL